MRDIGFLQGIFIPQAFTYWLKHQLYRDNQWLIFSHKAFHLKTHVYSYLEQPVFREKVKELENKWNFLKENLACSLSLLFCALQEIKSNYRMYRVTFPRHLLDLQNNVLFFYFFLPFLSVVKTWILM